MLARRLGCSLSLVGSSMFLDIFAGCLAYRAMVWPTIQSVYFAKLPYGSRIRCTL
jgi:hypothetical protein